MILGLSTAAFTLVHVALSLVGILAGAVVLATMIAGRRLDFWNPIFLATTVATSATGFLFHSASFGPPHVVGVISLVVLAVALLALYARHLAGLWRAVYATVAVLALYLNVFVGVVQAFQKLPFLAALAPTQSEPPFLAALAPTQSEPPFLAAQAVVLVAFIGLGYLAVRRLRPLSRSRLSSV